MKKLTKKFNALIIDIKVVNKKLKINYQISGPPVISKPAQRP